MNNKHVFSFANISSELRLDGVQHFLVAGLFVDDTVLFSKSKGMLQKVVDAFDLLYNRRKLKVNANKSKVMVFERASEEVVNFMIPYTVRIKSVKETMIMLGGEGMMDVRV